MLPETTPRRQRIPVQVRRRRTPPAPPSFLATQDVDYVATFRTAAYVNRLIELRGATTGRLLRRSNLYHALGDYVQSARDAEEIVRTDPKNGDGQFRLGAATLTLAIQNMDQLPSGPGTTNKTGGEDPRELLITARHAFLQAYRLNPRDQEAKKAAVTTKRYLDSLQKTRADNGTKPRKGVRCRL